MYENFKDINDNVLQNSCVLTYIATGALGWYGVAIQMEDFISLTSTTPLSSVPIQFLLDVFSDGRPCNVSIPELVPGETPPDGSCIPVSAGDTYQAGIVASSGGVGFRSVEQYIIVTHC